MLFTGTVSGDSSIIWGALGHDINLTIPNFQVTDTDEVRWEKGRTLVAQLKKEMKPFLLSEAFEILTNETLRIKKLKRDDNGTYNVIVYGANGSSKLQKAFDLRILGESSLYEVFPLLPVRCSELGCSVFVTFLFNISSVAHNVHSSGWGVLKPI